MSTDAELIAALRKEIEDLKRRLDREAAYRAAERNGERLSKSDCETHAMSFGNSSPRWRRCRR